MTLKLVHRTPGIPWCLCSMKHHTPGKIFFHFPPDLALHSDSQKSLKLLEIQMILAKLAVRARLTVLAAKVG